MLQFKNGQFQEIEESSILPAMDERGDYATASKDAGFEDWQSFGEDAGFRVAFYRRYDEAHGRAEWLVEMTNAFWWIR